jgi:uncharacterized RDD family membrane protein YckC
MPHLIGDASKERIFAFIIDNLFACLLAILLVAQLNSESPVLSGSVLSITYLSYFFVFELAWARTPGKIFQGLIVRDINGGPANAKQILIRTLVRMFEANPILFGGIPAGIIAASSANKQRLGDILAGTVVVTRDAARNHGLETGL